MDIEKIEAIRQALPPLALLLLAVALVAGLVLWLIGRKLARPTYVICGLVLGGIGGLVVGQALSDHGALALPLVIGGGIGGALLAALLFRVWMGISGALLLAMLAPAASMAVRGISLPTLELPEDAAEAIVEPLTRLATDDSQADPAATEGPLAQVGSALRSLYDPEAAKVRAWWTQLSSTGRFVLATMALIGGAIGLLLGLIMPYVAASFESALVGAILLFYPGRALLAHYLGDDLPWLPTTPRATLVVLGLITLLGLVIQWSLFHKRADQ